jgi:hypothetical protein
MAALSQHYSCQLAFIRGFSLVPAKPGLGGLGGRFHLPGLVSGLNCAPSQEQMEKGQSSSDSFGLHPRMADKLDRPAPKLDDLLARAVADKLEHDPSLLLRELGID